MRGCARKPLLRKLGSRVAYVPLMPLFTVSDEDEHMRVASSVGRAVGSMEPPEFDEGYYILMDATGRRARLKVVQWSVELDGWTEEGEVADLRRRIAAYLAFNGLDLDENLDDHEYVQQAALLVAIEEKKMSWPRWPSWFCGRLGK